MRDLVATFSIVAFDPASEELGVAVQSKFLAVGAVVPWVRPAVGAVATQAMANVSFGPRGLELMAEGRTAEETVEALVSADEGREDRQIGVVDARGRAATFTGGDCFDWAGGVTGDHYAAQGNILISEETVKTMARTYEETAGDLSPGGCSRRWTRGKRRAATRGGGSRRRCWWCRRVAGMVGRATALWTCAWTIIPTR